jgi:hypothetical protein
MNPVQVLNEQGGEAGFGRALRVLPKSLPDSFPDSSPNTLAAGFSAGAAPRPAATAGSGR